MRICYVTETYPPEVNGVALTVERAVRHLREHRHPVLLVRPRQHGEALLDSADEWRVTGVPIPMYPDLRFGLASVAALRHRIERAGAALVHVATPGPLGRAALLAADALDLPVTTDFRTNFHWYSRYYGLGWLEPALCRYLRGLHNRARCTFVPTRAMQALLASEGFERLEVLGRGVDTAQFTPARRSEALRASWGASDPERPVLLHVGRLAAEKNVALALAAFDALRGMRPDAKLVLVGDGPLRGALQARCPQACFVGVQRGAALAAHYASADLMLFPSESETFGNVTLEGMASGLGVVAFDAAAAAEHITDGRSGWLVPPGAHEAFISTVVHVGLATAAERGAVGRRAREQAARTTWDRVLEQFTRRLTQHALAAETGLVPQAAVA